MGCKSIHLLIALLGLSLSFGAWAQSQQGGQSIPYEMDEECYRLYQEGSTLLGKPGFQEVNEQLYRLAVQKEDKRGKVFYYINRLRDITRQPWETPAADTTARLQEAMARGDRVLAAQEEIKSMARETELPQYFYYSYSLTKNYFYNNRMQLRAMELVREMQDIAQAEGNEYGQWLAAKELASVYTAQEDYEAARRCLAYVLREHEVTSDPVIRSQAICYYYLDYSETFPPEHDSVRFYVQKALEARSTPQDSARCLFAQTKLSAMDMDLPRYRELRDQSLANPYMAIMLNDKPQLLFTGVDYILAGKGWENRQYFYSLNVSLIQFCATMAEKTGDYRLSNILNKHIVTNLRRSFTRRSRLNLAEMDAQLKNDLLTADLADKSRQVERISIVVTILVIVLFLVVLVALLLYIRNLRKTRDRDEKMIAELMEANEKVRLANEAKTRFVQNMSHEVRTPLNAIVGFSQLLSLPDGSFPPEEKEEFSSHIVNNTKMLTMLLDDILNASAMDSGNYRIIYEEGECSFMCHEAISSAEHRLQPGVSMKYISDKEGPFSFRTDPRRVQQILINLLTNACKHTPSGEIRLGYSLEEHPGEVAFFVEDTGPGVPADKADAIFDRFTKLNDFVQGTGLGLSICREIAGKMGGRVFLDTAYTEGARFVFVLPLTPPAVENDLNN